MIPRKNILWISLVLLGLASTAQVPHYKLHKLGESFKEAEVALVYQTQNGFLWFGSDQGLLQYDGFTFHSIVPADTLSSNEVSAIFEDSHGILWVGYSNGAIYQVSNLLELQPWGIEEGWPKVPITGFEETEDGNFWIATYGEGVYCYQGQHLYNFNTDDGLLGDDIYHMIRVGTHQIWVGTDGGISICEWENGKKRLDQITRNDGLPDDIVRTMQPDEKGNLWIGTYDKGICYLDITKRDVIFEMDNWLYGPVRSLEVFDNRELWVGTEGDGVYRYHFEAKTIQNLNPKTDRMGAKVWDLHKDQEGNIWIIDNIYGIRSANRQFEFIEEKLENVQATMVDHQGTLWLGSQNGVYTLGSTVNGAAHFKSQLPEQELNVISFFEDDFHNIWIGTFGDGLYCYQPASGVLRHFTEQDGLTNASILSIDGYQGQVWLATLGGVTEIDARQNIINQPRIIAKNYNLEGGLGTNFIYKVFVDSQGRTWFGTDGKGVSVLEEGSITNYAVADSLPIKAVYSITEDLNGHIWLSTAKEGLYEFDGTGFRLFGVEDGLRNLSITSLITDAKGRILVIHPEGIDILDPVTRRLAYYDEAIGITDFDPHLNVVCKDGAKNIWIGTQNGVMCYSTLDENLRSYPLVQLKALSVFWEPIDFKNRNLFLHNENNLIFDYAGLWYTDPASVKFKYILKDFDLDWIESRDQQESYSNLPPGKYAFHLGVGGGQQVQREDFIYEFRIKAPFWRQWWFILLMVLMLGSITYLIMRLREKQIQRESSLMKEKVESQYEALKSQINPHFLFNSFNTLIAIIEENPGTAVAFVERLSDFYRSILQYREKNVITLQEEMELVKNYAFLLEKRYGKNLKLSLSMPKEASGQFVAPLTVQMLVENAIKHNVISKSKPLHIHILVKDGYIEVRNNLQKKLTVERSTGFGLQSISTRYALLTDKKVKIAEEENEFRVGIPVLLQS